MPFLDYKPQKRISGTDLASSGDLGQVKLTDIRDPISRIIITKWGTGDGSNVPTVAELLASLGTIKISLAGSSIISWDADDLYYYIVKKHLVHPPYCGATGVSNDVNFQLILDFGFNDLVPSLENEWDWAHGLTHSPDKSLLLEIESGGETGFAGNSGHVDSCVVVMKGVPSPASYLGHRKYSYTAAAGTDERIGVPKGASLADLLIFITTNIGDGVTAETTTVENIALEINKEEEVLRSIKWEHLPSFALLEASEVADLAELDIYKYLPFIPPIAITQDTDLVLEGGDANAVRAYLGMLYPNR